jgi:hypothetical protein
MKNKTMINDSPSHCANMVLWVSAAMHKFKHGWLGFGQRSGKRGHAIGANFIEEPFVIVSKNDLSKICQLYDVVGFKKSDNSILSNSSEKK